MKNLNDWNNYSNWVYEDIPPYSNQYAYEQMAYNLNSSKHFSRAQKIVVIVVYILMII